MGSGFWIVDDAPLSNVLMIAIDPCNRNEPLRRKTTPTRAFKAVVLLSPSPLDIARRTCFCERWTFGIVTCDGFGHVNSDAPTLLTAVEFPVKSGHDMR